MKKKQIVVTILVMVLAMAGWWFLLYSPRKAQLAVAQTELKKEQAQEQTLKATLKRRQALKEMEPKLDLRLAQLSTWLPDQPNLPQFINDATAIAKESGIDFVSISPGLPTAGNAGQGVISLNMQINGGFFQLLDYLVRVEKLPRSVVGDSISISPQVEEGGGAVSLSVQVQGRMFMSSVPDFTTLPPGVSAAPKAGTETTGTVPGAPSAPKPTTPVQTAAPAPGGATAAPGRP